MCDAHGAGGVANVNLHAKVTVYSVCLAHKPYCDWRTETKMKLPHRYHSVTGAHRPNGLYTNKQRLLYIRKHTSHSVAGAR